MTKLKIKPNPNFERLLKVIKREGLPDRVPFYELYSNIESEVLQEIGQYIDIVDATWMSEKDINLELKQHINYMYNLGYDYVNVGAKKFEFPKKEIPKAITSEGERSYFQGATHTIASREDFEKYEWPKLKDIDYSPLERVEKCLPEGMKVIAQFSGILENVMWLLGYEGLSYLLYENRQLVYDMFEEIGSRIVTYYDNLASFDVVGALTAGDDLGFKTHTLFSPQVLREYVFPWHKKLVETIHKHKKPVIMHVCGCLNEIMEDIINCGWDAKHSFEDVIQPVWEVKEKYGNRIALMGGFDLDKISRMSEEEVRIHTRFIISKCAPGGGWALGTGNSVANYIPVNNFLTMLEEGFLIGCY